MAQRSVENESLFWYTSNRKIKGVLAHIVESTHHGETPAGTDCEESVAYCGEVCLGYTMGEMTLHYGRLKEAKDHKVSLCDECLRRYKNKCERPNHYC